MTSSGKATMISTYENIVGGYDEALQIDMSTCRDVRL
jgi:hypothetical protein